MLSANLVVFCWLDVYQLVPKLIRDNICGGVWARAVGSLHDVHRNFKRAGDFKCRAFKSYQPLYTHHKVLKLYLAVLRIIPTLVYVLSLLKVSTVLHCAHCPHSV